MKFLLRLVALASVALGALVLSGAAMAAYTSPRLEILNPSERVGGGGPLTIRVSQTRQDDATFRLVIYVPQGYTSSLVPQEGAQIGTASAQINATAISPDAIVPVTGRIIGDSFTPAKYPQGFGCVFGGPPTGTIDGVWRLELTAAGQTLVVPMYVQTVTSGPESAFASGKLTTCLPSPYPEAGAARAALGAKLINASLTLPSLFANPATAGAYRWRSIWTPYTPNSASPNAAGTVEAQAVDVLPAQLAFTSARFRNGRIFVTGTLLENRVAVRNARVRILAGRTARGVRQVTTVRTNARGRFTAVIRWRRPGRVFLNARVAQLARQTACTTPTNPAVQCLRSVTSGYTLAANRTVRVR
jgi:hypothetical protein